MMVTMIVLVGFDAFHIDGLIDELDERHQSLVLVVARRANQLLHHSVRHHHSSIAFRCISILHSYAKTKREAVNEFGVLARERLERFGQQRQSLRKVRNDAAVLQTGAAFEESLRQSPEIRNSLQFAIHQSLSQLRRSHKRLDDTLTPSNRLDVQQRLLDPLL
jgi:hypothetical protein